MTKLALLAHTKSTLPFDQFLVDTASFTATGREAGFERLTVTVLPATELGSQYQKAVRVHLSADLNTAVPEDVVTEVMQGIPAQATRKYIYDRMNKFSVAGSNQLAQHSVTLSRGAENMWRVNLTYLDNGSRSIATLEDFYNEHVVPFAAAFNLPPKK